MQTCFYESDGLSKIVAEFVKEETKGAIKPHVLVDYAKPFIFLNGSNNHHHRTLEFIRQVSGKTGGYVHIDQHDDIAILSGASQTGPANFVESILDLGKTVIFVGQRYWSHKIWFRGKEHVMLLRNNLQRYKPLDKIFFLEKTCFVLQMLLTRTRKRLGMGSRLLILRRYFCSIRMPRK